MSYITYLYEKRKSCFNINEINRNNEKRRFLSTLIKRKYVSRFLRLISAAYFYFMFSEQK